MMGTTVIIGGGITGLATAYYLQDYAGSSVDYKLIESSSRLGGKISSASQTGFLIEGGPDSFLTQKTSAIDLCRALGLEEKLIGSNSTQPTTTYVWSKEQLHPMPEGMMLMAPTMILPFLRSKLISWPGKIRMGLEVFVPKSKKLSDETLGSFVRRRLGNEALNKIAGPLMAGIHAADPDKLSLHSTFPLFVDIEEKHGSLLLGMMKKKKQPKTAATSKRTPMFMSLRGGLQQLADAVISHLNADALWTNCRIQSIVSNGDQYRVNLRDGSHLIADDIVFATPAYVTADLVRQIDEKLAEKLCEIRYVSTATVSLGFKRKDIVHPLNGFGFIVPHSEQRKITACSWSSTKFSNRAPDDCILIRVFIGGALAEDLAERDEEALVRIARHELQDIMGITATPILARAYRWHKANPQYDLGHRSRIEEIERLVGGHPGLHLAGAAYRGAGIPDCIQSGMKIALRIAQKQNQPRVNSTDTALPVPVHH
jgi:oxygen-dependent protoporphyrinogen oxidase